MYLKTPLRFIASLLLVFSLITTTLSSNGKGTGAGFNAGNASFVMHDYGIKVTRNTTDASPYDLYQHPYIFNNKTTDYIWVTGIAAAVIRAALVPLESRLVHDHSASGNVKKAFISLVRCVEEICYLLKHPDDEHLMDLTWAIVDAAQVCKHVAAACKATVTTNETIENATPVEIPEIKSAGMTPRQVTALLEGICATTSMAIPTDSTTLANSSFAPLLRKVNFSARSTMSFLRLLRNFNDVPEGDETTKQRNIYAALMGLQVLYTSIKFGMAHFEPIEANRNPHDSSFNDEDDNNHNNDDYYYFGTPKRPANWRPGMMIPSHLLDDVHNNVPNAHRIVREMACENLELPVTATDAEARKAYMKLALKYHPDKNKDKAPAEKAASEAKFKVISEANAVVEEIKKKYPRS